MPKPIRRFQTAVFTELSDRCPQMPVMNGLEATRQIRALESGQRVPIIALTANVMPGDRERCLESGMDEFLTKPFKLDQLSAKLEQFLGGA